MKTEDYIKDATVTDLMDYGPVLERLQNIHTVRLLHAAMGLCTEAGEFLDMLKKHILYGKPLDEVNLKEELGDKLWYTALALDELKSTFGEVMEVNIAKLRARYPNKFTETDAINRDLDKERKILEGNPKSHYPPCRYTPHQMSHGICILCKKTELEIEASR